LPRQENIPFVVAPKIKDEKQLAQRMDAYFRDVA